MGVQGIKGACSNKKSAHIGLCKVRAMENQGSRAITFMFHLHLLVHNCCFLLCQLYQFIFQVALTLARRLNCTLSISRPSHTHVEREIERWDSDVKREKGQELMV